MTGGRVTGAGAGAVTGRGVVVTAAAVSGVVAGVAVAGVVGGAVVGGGTVVGFC